MTFIFQLHKIDLVIYLIKEKGKVSAMFSLERGNIIVIILEENIFGLCT